MADTSPPAGPSDRAGPVASDLAPGSETRRGHELPEDGAVEPVRLFRCYNCDPPHEFSSEVPVCRQCGADARKPDERVIVPLATIHFDPPHPVIRDRGRNVMACTGKFWSPGTIVSGETAVVNCPACRETDAFKALERQRHQPGATALNRERVETQVSQLYVDRPRALESELADAFVAIATGIRECTRLVASIYYLWTREDEYRRLAACVADAATAARAAYLAVDIRLRRAGGPNAMQDALKDVLTVQGRAPLDPTGVSGGLNAVLTHLHTTWDEMFPRVEGRGCIERMLDQLARVLPATNIAFVAAGPLPVVPAPPLTGTTPPVGEKPAPSALFVPLTSWNGILAALNEPHGRVEWKNVEQTRALIRKLNSKHNGPILFPGGSGKQPAVDKAALMLWWGGLHEHFDARIEEERSAREAAQLTVADSHNFGATGKVVPGIGGSEKRTRTKRDKKGKKGKS